MACMGPPLAVADEMPHVILDRHVFYTVFCMSSACLSVVWARRVAAKLCEVDLWPHTEYDTYSDIFDIYVNMYVPYGI